MKIHSDKDGLFISFTLYGHCYPLKNFIFVFVRHWYRVWNDETFEMYENNYLDQAWDDPMTEYIADHCGGAEINQLFRRQAKRRYNNMSLFEKLLFRERFLEARYEHNLYTNLLRAEQL